MPLVFQSGSNCAVARMNGPGRLNGRAQTLEDYDIAIDVRSLPA